MTSRIEVKLNSIARYWERAIAVLKDNISLSKLDDEETNVFQKSLIDRYQHRPQELQSICLTVFATTYVTKYESSIGSECDVLPASKSEITSTQIVLTNGFGKMKKCTKQAVIRF